MRSKESILVVEDEPIVAKVIQGMLEHLGYAVAAVAPSGEEAIKKVAETHPGLVLMDIALEGNMDGIQAAEQTRARFDIPVVYLTARSDEDTLQRAKIAEPYGYIFKPFEKRELHTTIEMALYKHKMEMKLKNSEQWLATILKSIVDAVISTDIKGFVKFMNPVAEALTGWKQKDVLGRDLTEVFDIINEETRKVTEDIIAKAIRGGVVVGLVNHILIAKDGTEIPIDSSAAPIIDDKGNVTGVVLVFRDITERRRAEETLRRAHDELEIQVQQRTAELKKANEALKAEITERKRVEERRAQLLNELESANQELKDFAYIVSHDLKAPLRAISSLVDWISTDYADKFDEEGKEMLSLLLGRAKRMQDLIDGVLQYSRIGRIRGEKVEVNLNELVAEVIDMIAPPENISIKVENELPSILFERTRIEQVFQNLLSNGVKFMDKPKGEIKIGCVEDGSYWKFSVADNGPGIEEKYFEKIFQIFQTLSPRDELESTGVGLSVVKKIVETYGGKIWVESKVGYGSTFFFTLPK